MHFEILSKLRNKYYNKLIYKENLKTFAKRYISLNTLISHICMHAFEKDFFVATKRNS